MQGHSSGQVVALTCNQPLEPNEVYEILSVRPFGFSNKNLYSVSRTQKSFHRVWLIVILLSKYILRQCALHGLLGIGIASSLILSLCFFAY